MSESPGNGFSVGALLSDAARRLGDAGVESPRLDARVLLGFALGRDAGWLIGHRDDVPPDAACRQFETLIRRRAAREPVAYILGVREFWSLSFRVTPATLIPRPETETLVEAVLAAYPDTDAPLRILDLGTGSGCILLALLHERPAASGTGVDVNADAVLVAAENARSLGLAARAEFRRGDWFGPLVRDEMFDVVVTNPPYVSAEEMAALAPEIADHEPEAALFAGDDGLDAYREIFSGLPGWLRPGGLFAGEIGHRQGVAAAELARAQGFGAVEIRPDGAGLPRLLVGRFSGE